MQRISLTQNKFALVDDEDFEWLNQWKWYANWNGRCWYAIRSSYPRIRMHRLILGLQSDDKRQIDHKNRNGFDNQRDNLRIATKGQNAVNTQKFSHGLTSKYKGVYWNKLLKKWSARIKINQKEIYLGLFSNEGLAARMYDIAARYFFW